MIEDCEKVTSTDIAPADGSRAGDSDNRLPDAARPALKQAKWSDRVRLGIPLIDEQHKRFFDLAATFNGDGDEVRVLKTLAVLSDYIRLHLRDEETLMASVRYPEIEAHRRLHAEFRRMLAGLLGRARRMSLDEIAEEVKYLVNGWFYNHIVTVDSEYASYVAADHKSRSR